MTEHTDPMCEPANSYSYVVVDFVNEGTVDIVHKSWIFEVESNGCKVLKTYWPGAGASRCAKNGVKPNERIWESFVIRKLFETSSYAVARKRADDAQYTSNFDTEDEEVTTGRKRRLPERFGSEEEEEEDDNEHYQPPKKSRLPSLPRLPLAPRLPSAPSLSFPGPSTQAANSSPRFTSPRPPTSQPRDPTYTPSSHDRSVQRQLAELREAVKELGKGQQEMIHLLQALKSGKNAADGELPELPPEVKIPVDEVVELRKLNDILQDPESRNALAANLITTGGKDFKDMTRRVISSLVTDRCACNLNWLGGGEKTAFNEMTLLLKVIHEVLRKKFSETDTRIDAVIKDWLKFSSSRVSRRTHKKEFC